MGSCRTTIEIGDQAGQRSETIDALMSTSATFTKVPRILLESLDIPVDRNYTAVLADGRRVPRHQLGFAHFKRRKRGNPPFGGTEWRGVPVHQGRRLTVRNPPTPTTGADAPGRWHPRRSATVCRTRPQCAG